MTVTLKDRQPPDQPESSSDDAPTEPAGAETQDPGRGRRQKRREGSKSATSEAQSARKARRRSKRQRVGTEEENSGAAPAGAQEASRGDREQRRAARKEARKSAAQEAGSKDERRARKKARQSASEGDGRKKGRREQGADVPSTGPSGDEPRARARLDEEDDSEGGLSETDAAEEAELGAQDPDADLAGADEPADEEAAPADRRSATPRKRELTSPVATAVFGKDEGLARRVFESARAVFGTAGLELSQVTDKADFVLSVGPLPEETSPPKGKLVTVLTGTPDGDADAVLARAAKAKRALFVPLTPLVRRYGGERVLDRGELSAEGAEILAGGIRDGVLLANTGIMPHLASRIAAPADLAGAQALAERPSEVLRTLNWPKKSMPRLLRPRMDAQSIEQLADGNIQLSAEQIVPLEFPIDWQKKPENRRAEYALYGLDFVCSTLTYWFAKANRVTSERLTPIDTALKQRNVTASALLARAAEVMADCLAQGDALPNAAWRLAVVQRRARAFTMFLLCCRMAALHRIKFDEAACGRVFRGLVETLDRLRPRAVTEMGTASGVAQAAYLAALALPLRKIPFGRLLLEESMESLCTYQLEMGLSADGVWQEGFTQHCAVLDKLRSLGSDLRDAEISPRILSAPILSLAKFAHVFLTDDGMVPAIAELTPASNAKTRKAARSIVQGAAATANRIKAEAGALRDAALFSDSGFFISRSPKTEGKPNSHLVVQARPASAGGVSLSFALGPVRILVGGGTTEKKAPADTRRASRLEPATHNALRINGQNYARASKDKPQAIRIDGAWEEKHWAAVRVINEAFPEAAVARTVIHLKPIHGLLVVDELVPIAEAVKFEQFWHLGPDLTPLVDAQPQLAFDAGEGGVLSVAWDADAGAELVAGGQDHIGWTATPKREVVRNPYLRREVDGSRAHLASFFRVAATSLRHDLTVEPTSGGWRVTVVGDGLKVRFVFADGQLKLAA